MSNITGQLGRAKKVAKHFSPEESKRLKEMQLADRAYKGTLSQEEALTFLQGDLTKADSRSVAHAILKSGLYPEYADIARSEINIRSPGSYVKVDNGLPLHTKTVTAHGLDHYKKMSMPEPKEPVKAWAKRDDHRGALSDSANAIMPYMIAKYGLPEGTNYRFEKLEPGIPGRAKENTFLLPEERTVLLDEETMRKIPPENWRTIFRHELAHFSNPE